MTSINENITVVVCCKGDPSALLLTVMSINCLETMPREVIFCLKDVALPELELKFAYSVLVDDGDGVYHAMNFSLRFVKTFLVTFLNASDVYEGDPLRSIDRPGLLPYRVVGARLRKFSVVGFHFTVFGLGYCHQGVVYCASKLSYTTRYKISADFLSICENFHDLTTAPRFSSGAAVFFKGGISSQNSALRDSEIYSILIERRRFAFATFFKISVFFKNIAKLFL